MAEASQVGHCHGEIRTFNDRYDVIDILGEHGASVRLVMAKRISAEWMTSEEE